MNAERLLDAFNRLGDGPETVQQFRKVVVGLAMSGRLVAPDEPVMDPANLLKQIEAKKRVLVQQGVLRRQDPPAALSLEDLPKGFNNPTNFVRLGSIARIEKGLTGITKADPGPYPLVVTAEDRASCDHFDFDAAAAIVPLVSSAGHGKASLQRLHYQEGKFALGSILAAIFPHAPELISARFLFEYLTSLKDELLVSQMIGTANVSLSVGKVSDVPVPLVPPSVQRKVDELMALCDRLEAARGSREGVRDRLAAASLVRLNAPDPDTFQADARFALNALPALTTRADQIKALRQTILNLAVRGKLVPQDPSDEPAAELLKSIATEKARLVKAGVIRKGNPLPPISEYELPFNLPRGWAWVRLGDLIHLVSGQHLQPPEYSEDPRGGLPYITGPSDFAVEGLQISRFALVRKAVAKKGQLLLTVKGSGVGKTTTCNIPEVAISRQLMALSAISWDDRFLVLITHRLAEKLQEGARSLIPGISRENVEEFVFPLPPLAEQHRIVAKVDALMALCDRLEASLTATAATRRRLLDALLAEALAPADAQEMEAAE